MKTADSGRLDSTLEMIAAGLDDLPGEIRLSISDQHDSFIRNEIVVLAEQRLDPAVKYGAWIPVTQQFLDEADVLPSLAHAFDRGLRPWRYPDRNPIPTFDPVPWFTRSRAIASEARERARAAWSTLRHGMPDNDEDDW